VRAHRDWLRQQGLRPIQIWVPEVRSPAFKAEAHRSASRSPNRPHSDEDQAITDAVSIRAAAHRKSFLTPFLTDTFSLTPFSHLFFPATGAYPGEVPMVCYVQ
jgi:hypothetical protein